MKISRTMIRDHLRGVTVNYFSDHNVAPDDIGDYATFAKHVRETAERRGDLDWFKHGIEHVLRHPEESCEDLNGGIYPFGEEDMRDVIEVVWEALWPDSTLADPAIDVELVEMPRDDWDAHKATNPL